MVYQRDEMTILRTERAMCSVNVVEKRNTQELLGMLG